MTLCRRCRAVLERRRREAFDATLALALAAALMLVLAYSFPLVTLNVQAQQSSTTLFDTVLILWHEDMRALAALVAFTTIVAPGLEALALIYVLLHIRAARARSRLAAFALRIFHAVDAWSMTEVFMLGALVALVKLRDYAEVRFGIALWSLGAAMLLLAAVGASLNLHAAWARLGERA